MSPRRLLTPALAFLAAFAAAETPVTGWRLTEASGVTGEGETVSVPGYRAQSWIPAVVPGTVLTSMVQAGRYPEPLYGLNNLDIPESLCRQSYWYRTEVDVPKSNAGRHIWIRFDGVNYIAEVWVDGHHVGTVRGAFARGLFDITPWVKPGERAAIAVKILPPNHPGVPHEQSLARGTGPNGGDTGADGVTIASTVGWDWIPGIRDREMGLWQGVAMFTTGDVTIRDPFVKTDLPLPRLDSAELTVSTTLRNESSTQQAGTLEGRIEGTHLTFRMPIRLEAGETKDVAFSTMTLAKPKLWWPNGYGKQNLYQLKLRFVAGGRESDTKETRFGVREIAYFRNGSDKMVVQVNGVSIMCRGGNWGIDEAMKRSPDARIDAQLRLHHDANCNMVRNWVGQSTQENFYAACDKYGILVWDDFWLANPADGPVPVDESLFLDNAQEKILRYRNHPSIAVWCGRNEGFPPPHIEAGLQRMTKDLDGTRFYQPHSAATNGVSGGGPYGQVPFARYFTVGDAMHTEVGAPSIPTVESIEGMMPKQDWWPINDDWAYHDLARGAQGGDRYMTELSRRYGRVSGFKDFVRKGAMLTYETYRAMFEGRNSRLFAPASGTLLWMSNPAQPSFVWQLYHHDLDPTAAMFGTKVAGEPIHVQMTPEGDVQVVNTTTHAVRLHVARQQFDVDGTSTETSVATVEAKPLSTTSAEQIEKVVPKRIARVRAIGMDGQLISENVYWPSEPSFLSRLPQTVLVGSTSRNRGSLKVTLRNPSKTVALLTHLSLRDKDGKRVLPAFYSDNFVHIFPGETKTITIEGAGGTQVYVDGWNVDGVKGPGLVYNEEARPEPPLPPAPPRAVLPGTVLSIDAGGEDVPGSPWNPDEEFVSGGENAHQPGTITGSDLPQDVLQTERWGECVYTIPVRAGSYKVRLVFAETSQPRIGGRRFNVSVGRQRVLQEFDIFAEAGGANKAVVKEFTTEPDRNGNLTISFRKGSANEPEVRAIQVLKS
jgi:beta-mannosidase